MLDFETLAGEDRIVIFGKGTIDQKILCDSYQLVYVCINIMWGLTLAGLYAFGPGVTISCVLFETALVLPSTTRKTTTELALRVSRTLCTYKATWCNRCFCVQIWSTVLPRLYKYQKLEHTCEPLCLQARDPSSQEWACPGPQFRCHAPPLAQQLGTPVVL